MFYSGISDESGQDIATQIKAHQELGWNHMELRLVDGENLTLIDDAKFEAVYGAVTEAGMRVSCFSSAIANWARPITCDSSIDIEDLERCNSADETFWYGIYSGNELSKRSGQSD